MTFEADFLDLMPHTVTRKAFASRDNYGKPSYSTAVSSYQARVVATPMTAWTPQGLTLIATHKMYLATTDTISAEDQITYGGSTYKIVQVGMEPDEDGAHHTWLATKGS